MLFAYMVECTDQTTFENREKAFDGIGSHCATGILFSAVIDVFVRGIISSRLTIEIGAIGVDMGVFADILGHCFFDG